MQSLFISAERPIFYFSMSTEKDMRVYELGFLLVPTIADEHISEKFQVLKDLISSHGGQFIAEDFPKMIPLQYEMLKVISNKNHRFNDAYFGWIKFDMEPEQITLLDEEIKRSVDVIRFLLIKTVRENTVVGKKTIGKTDGKKRVHSKGDEEAPVGDVTPEQIDKEIDALVEETPVV